MDLFILTVSANFEKINDYKNLAVLFPSLLDPYSVRAILKRVDDEDGVLSHFGFYEEKLVIPPLIDPRVDGKLIRKPWNEQFEGKEVIVDDWNCRIIVRRWLNGKRHGLEEIIFGNYGMLRGIDNKKDG